MSGILAEEVAKKIRDAFTDTPYPGDDNIGIHDPFDGDVVEEAFRGKHWKDLSLELIVANHDKLLFLTPDAYRFYLSAYLLATLFHDFDQLDTIPDRIIGSLVQPEPEHDRPFRERVRSFRQKEKEAIYAYLKSYKALFPQANWFYIPSVRERLEQATQFWSRFDLSK